MPPHHGNQTGIFQHLKPIHVVSAWAASARLVLGQVKIEEKTNEIPMVPALLRLLDIQGCIVTTDAMSCQKATAAQIIAQGGDYVLAVKENQKHLYEDIQGRFAHASAHKFEDTYAHHCTENDTGHGRIETRCCDLITLSHRTTLARPTRASGDC